MLVCIGANQPAAFDDNLKAPCSDCGVMLQFRPHVAYIQRKLCFACATEAIDGEDEPVTIHLTKKTQRELRQYRLDKMRREQN